MDNMNDRNDGREQQGFNPSYTPLDVYSAKKEEQQPPENQTQFGQSDESQQAQGQPQPQTDNSRAAQQPQPQPQPQPQTPPFGTPNQQNGWTSRPSAPPYGGQRPEPQNGKGYAYNQNSGEYRYVPPFAKEAFRPPYTPPAAHQPQPACGKKEKKGRSFSTGAIVAIIAACVLLSFGFGMLGSIVTGMANGDRGTAVSNDPLVVNKGDSDDDIDGDDEDLADGLIGVCAKVSESVVEITTEFNTSWGNYQYVNEGAGSGVIISDNGHIITNNHVITNSSDGSVADSVKVRLTNGSEYDATVIGHDSDTDIAIIKIEAEGLKAATVGDSDTLKVGERVVAVGNPLGELGGTVTYGIVSATNREISVDNNRMTLIQIDASINPGNSGGGLFNMDGELVGIVNAKSTGVDIEGLGFAIPVNEAVDIAGELKTNGYVSGRTYVGISLTDVTDSFTAYYYFRSENAGVYISQVQEGYNDDVLKYGDRITAIEGNEVSSSQDVKEAVKSHKVGDKIKFTLSRQGKLIDVEVTCYEYTPENEVNFKNR